MTVTDIVSMLAANSTGIIAVIAALWLMFQDKLSTNVNGLWAKVSAWFSREPAVPEDPSKAILADLLKIFCQCKTCEGHDVVADAVLQAINTLKKTTGD